MSHVTVSTLSLQAIKSQNPSKLHNHFTTTNELPTCIVSQSISDLSSIVHDANTLQAIAILTNKCNESIV